MKPTEKCWTISRTMEYSVIFFKLCVYCVFFHPVDNLSVGKVKRKFAKETHKKEKAPIINNQSLHADACLARLSTTTTQIYNKIFKQPLYLKIIVK